MAVLCSELRNRLEDTVKTARRQSEAAAKATLERLTIGNAEPGGHLSIEERQLRNRLRAHGRQLGDQRDTKTGTQSTNKLVHECAYEHWHRMLFARFLAENNLLIHDKERMPVTLAECDELAADEGAPDGWALAARYAARMLPQIFRPDDPVLQVDFAPEHKRGLEKLLTNLPGEIFTAEDSLGWVYQFWQTERKDEVNASGDKITGETLPAVTQLFTEHYMVLFLLHNTIGAWWAARLKTEGRIPKAEWDRCQTEDDCRRLVAVPGYEFTYLRFIKNSNGEWVPAAGDFPGWPKSLKQFRLLDPCCGSGHFLVAAFLLLVLMRVHDEDISAKDACDAVLHENLHGLELDSRCTQIAAFTLALTAWKFTQGFRPLPSLNIACSGLGANARKEDWLALANGDTRLRSGLELLYELFQKASELGSLINPRRLAPGDLVTASFTELQPLLEKALAKESKDDTAHEMAVVAHGLAKAAEILGGQFTLVATNVPYLGRLKQNEVLRDYCERIYPDSKTDLATCFLERCLAFCTTGGSTALVTPQNWLFLGTFTRLREKSLTTKSWHFVVLLGEEAWWTFGMRGPRTVLLGVSEAKPQDSNWFFGIDVSTNRAQLPILREEKAARLADNSPSTVTRVSQKLQLANPDAAIVFKPTTGVTLLSEYADSCQGSGLADIGKYRRFFWEIEHFGEDWVLHASSPDGTGHFSGLHFVTFWQKGRGNLVNEPDVTIRGRQAWNKLGVACAWLGSLPTGLYLGTLYDNSAAGIIPKNPNHLPAIWCFCSSPSYLQEVRKINHKPQVANAALVKVPFNLAHWQKVASEKYPAGLPKPDSNDPTQWLFNGRLEDSTAPLQVGVARLLGYRWPRQCGQTVSGAAPVMADGLEQFVDEDGIVCIPSVRGEAAAPERLRALLASAYGKKWTPTQLDELLHAVDYAGSTLEDWLRNGFFVQHCKLFQHRPFIWQIWDGRKDGFSALLNYHKLDQKLLEKLTYTYIGDWIKKQLDAVANEESGADDCLLKARQLQEKLKLILEGEKPFDIFVRWKPLEQQPVGWNPDLNDGVRLNIRPFLEAEVLRKRPNIKWGVDRGKNPPGSPWGEERNNDRHLSLKEKREARTS